MITTEETKKGLLRMKPNQYKSARALIKGLCANYDSTSGLCLPMDTACPQMITQSVICKYFRDVLLEDKDGQDLKAELYKDENIRKCEVCGRPFRALSNRAKYCAACSMEIQKKQARARKRKERGINVTL